MAPSALRHTFAKLYDIPVSFSHSDSVLLYLQSPKGGCCSISDLLFCFFFQINWHTVYWGFMLQFIAGVIFLRTVVGASAMVYLRERFEELTLHADTGSEFVFGPRYKEFPFIFQVKIREHWWHPVLFAVTLYLSILHRVTHHLIWIQILHLSILNLWVLVPIREKRKSLTTSYGKAPTPTKNPKSNMTTQNPTRVNGWTENTTHSNCRLTTIKMF